MTKVVRGGCAILDGRPRSFVNFVAPVTRGGEVIGTAGVNLCVQPTAATASARSSACSRWRRCNYEHAPDLAVGLRTIRGEDLVRVADNPKTGELPLAMSGSRTYCGANDRADRRASRRRPPRDHAVPQRPARSRAAVAVRGDG
ncbi:MAG: hypothetical protein IPJ34_22235 [Myxococcales bacterium]|nr:hypothetical protein [Myxococcales bacterium]